MSLLEEMIINFQCCKYDVATMIVKHIFLSKLVVKHSKQLSLIRFKQSKPYFYHHEHSFQLLHSYFYTMYAVHTIWVIF